ncbi:MAG: ATPase, partial [Bacteroidales bacterium]|nr:ATPase [Bacteroidales bacterium]
MAGPATKTLQNVPGPTAEWQTWNAFKQIKGGRAKDFEVAITWLKDAGLIYKIHRVPKIEYPLKFYEDFDVFKVFPLD